MVKGERTDLVIYRKTRNVLAVITLAGIYRYVGLDRSPYPHTVTGLDPAG
jgi:hypothetical protein